MHKLSSPRPPENHCLKQQQHYLIKVLHGTEKYLTDYAPLLARGSRPRGIMRSFITSYSSALIWEPSRIYLAIIKTINTVEKSLVKGSRISTKSKFSIKSRNQVLISKCTQRLSVVPLMQQEQNYNYSDCTSTDAHGKKNHVLNLK